VICQGVQRFRIGELVSGWPFLLAGLMKCGYDMALLLMFSHIRPPEEQPDKRPD